MNRFALTQPHGGQELLVVDSTQESVGNRLFAIRDVHEGGVVYLTGEELDSLCREWGRVRDSGLRLPAPISSVGGGAMQSTIQNTTRLDWRPVVRSLLARFQKAGFAIHSVDDGGDEQVYHVGSNRQKLFDAAEAVCGVDEATVRLRRGDSKVTLFLVLGNAPCETVCDYGASPSVMGEVDHIVEAFSDSWEGRRCPVAR